MGLLSALLGGGKLKPEVRAELEAEGLVLAEEKLRGSIRYSHFKAPGKRFHGKVVPMRMAVGLSEARIVIYGGVGAPELVDSQFDSPRLGAVDFSVSDGDKLKIFVDYDRMEDAEGAKVSGQITITIKTPNAPQILDQIQARLG